MSSSNQQEWQRKMQDLKIEVDKATSEPIIPEILSSIDGEIFEGAAWQEKIANTQNWFERMPASGKLAVVVGAAIIGLMLLKTVFQLVTSLITLGIVGVALWLVYRYVINKNNQVE
jgi:hypothetical protein